MRELGEGAAAMHEEVGAFIKEKKNNLLLCTGEYCHYTAAGYGEGAVTFNDKRELMNALPDMILSGDAVLVKASLACDFAEVSNVLAGLEENGTR